MSKYAVKRIAIGGDHAGYSMKAMLVEYLGAEGIEVTDCGPADDSPCDFPDVAETVCKKLLGDSVDRCILVCGSGVGVSVAANKMPGIRASLCHDSYSARQGVEHDDMNALCIGARVIGPELAMEIVRSYLGARYEPQDRHRRRVDKIVDIERRALAGEYGTP